MEKGLLKLSHRIAKLVLITAKASAGMQSANGWYQPKVPKRLAK